jgi:hypothetical protein
MDKSEQYELIERYLTNEMPEVQRLAFEQQLSKNKALIEELRLHKDLSDVFKAEKLHKFLDALNKANANWPLSVKKKESNRIKMNTRIVLAIAASLATLFFTLQLFFTTSDEITGKELFTQHFEPYPMVLSQRSEADTAGHASLVNMAVQQYSDGNYTLASVAFNQLRNLEPGQISYRFYFALSLLGANDISNAIDVLEDLLETPGHLFMEQSRWYLALAYLAASDENRALEILKEIQPGQFQYSKSRELLSELN